jgi:hypothetical protein
MTSGRVYTALLRLYPRSLRDEYGAEMTAAFAQLRRTTNQSSIAFWLFVAVDVARSATMAQIDECRRGSRRVALRLAVSSLAGLSATVAAAHGTNWLYGYFYHPYLEGRAIPALPYGVALGLVLGGTVGLAQRLLLPARVRRASAWALASAVAAPIAVLFCSAAIERALSGLNPVAADPSAVDLFAVTVTHARTWMDLALQFGAMTASALAVRAVIKAAKTSRHALLERHAH